MCRGAWGRPGMATECSSFHSALTWYSGELVRRRRCPPAEAQRQLEWLREFGESFPQRVDPANVGQREVIIYFAEHCDDFADPVEWYYRYKAIETFYEDMTSEFGLPSNQIKGLYDESDLEPELLAQIPESPRAEPVAWSREEQNMY